MSRADRFPPGTEFNARGQVTYLPMSITRWHLQQAMGDTGPRFAVPRTGASGEIGRATPLAEAQIKRKSSKQRNQASRARRAAEKRGEVPGGVAPVKSP